MNLSLEQIREIANYNDNVANFVIDYLDTYTDNSPCVFPDGESMYDKYENMCIDILERIGYVGDIDIHDICWERISCVEYDPFHITLWYENKPEDDYCFDDIAEFLLEENKELILDDSYPYAIGIKEID